MTMNISLENMKNLCHLWQVVAETDNSFHESENLEYCWQPDEVWPNRLWFLNDITSENWTQALEIQRQCDHRLAIPLWGEQQLNFLKEQNHNLTLSFEQIGMSVELSKEYDIDDDLTLINVTDMESARLWCDLLKQGFGHNFNPELILKSSTKIPYSIVYYDNIPIGTAILYITNRIAGIHTIGIAPEQRRKGYAEKLMFLLLNQAIRQKCSHAVLQASALGQGLYEKLGFEANFSMGTFIWKE